MFTRKGLYLGYFPGNLEGVSEQLTLLVVTSQLLSGIRTEKVNC